MKLNGYRPSHRNRWHLISEKVLSREEFLVFEVYLDSMVCYRDKDLFGQANVTLEEIAKILGYKSASGVSKHRAKLVKLGILIPTSKESVFKIYNAERYLPKNSKSIGKASAFAEGEKNQPAESILENIGSHIQLNENRLQQNEDHLQYNEIKLQHSETKSIILPKQSTSKELLSSFNVVSNISLEEKEKSLAEIRSFTKEQWEHERINDPGLPSWENKQLIEEVLRESSPIK